MEELAFPELQALKQDLTDIRKELQHVLEVSERGTRPVDIDEPIGRLSRMDAMQQQSMARANRQTADLRLKQVNAALKRFSHEEYGYCLECEEPIGYRRLKVRPEAPLCISCQSERERR